MQDEYGGFSVQWRNTNLPSSGNLSPEGFEAAITHFRPWVHDQLAMAQGGGSSMSSGGGGSGGRSGSSGDTSNGALLQMVATAADLVGAPCFEVKRYKHLDIGGVRFTTAAISKQRGGSAGCCWVIAPAAVAPDLSAKPRMAWGQIQDILVHSSRPLSERGQTAQRVTKMEQHTWVIVKWHMLPGAAASQRPYDKQLHVPVIPSKPVARVPRGLPCALPACEIVPLDVVVLPHPLQANHLVVLPVHGSVYFACEAGYDEPSM